ncbi:uncharacterized protein [Periplaneta americana]
MEVSVDGIKAEPKMDPLTLKDEVTKVEQEESVPMVGNFVKVDVNKLDVEPSHVSYHHAPNIKCEEYEDLISYPVVKFEPEEEPCNTDLVKEEMASEMMTEDDDWMTER